MTSPTTGRNPQRNRPISSAGVDHFLRHPSPEGRRAALRSVHVTRPSMAVKLRDQNYCGVRNICLR
jgi:hypothetical protein